jgi:hypothetical protein
MPRRNGIDEMYTGAVRVFASLIIIFGVVILVSTLVKGGGPLSVGFLLGLAFLGLGCGRLYLARR